MANVENKIVLVTGASSGIGEATARLLAEKGAKVVMGARRLERLKAIAADISETGGTVDFQYLDVTDAQSVKDFVAFALERFGRVDVLFNNAGVMPLSPMNAIKMDEWNSIIDINIRGVLHGIAAVLPVMEEQGSGHIINTASTAAHAVAASCGVYCASKHAVRAISEGLRQETEKVRVTLISPGVTTTELGHDITDSNAAEMVRQLRAHSLSPQSIANAVLFAVSQPADVDVNEMIIRTVTTHGHAF